MIGSDGRGGVRRHFEKSIMKTEITLGLGPVFFPTNKSPRARGALHAPALRWHKELRQRLSPYPPGSALFFLSKECDHCPEL